MTDFETRLREALEAEGVIFKPAALTRLASQQVPVGEALNQTAPSVETASQDDSSVEPEFIHRLPTSVDPALEGPADFFAESAKNADPVLDEQMVEAMATAFREATRFPSGVARFSPAVARTAAQAALTAMDIPRMLEGAWRDGWALCKASASDDEQFRLTDDVQADAWADSATAKAIRDKLKGIDND